MEATIHRSYKVNLTLTEVELSRLVDMLDHVNYRGYSEYREQESRKLTEQIEHVYLCPDNYVQDQEMVIP